MNEKTIRSDDLADNSILTYSEWMKEVDKHILKIAGVTSDDLADGPSRSQYDSGVSAKEYAEELLEDEGFPFEE